ncbi:hypothetical protein [Candidatus Methanomassiliicoccus intestinalis]|jgi:hypothetical protein|nr:hypothetical protein [Candidatus Methanomassiliicoccus intestinalis]
MMENSKEAADAGSFGTEAHFHGSVSKKELVEAARAAVISTADEIVRKRGILLGHVKLFISANGTLKLNMVDPTMGIDMDDKLNDPVVDGEIKYMAAAMGVSDDELENIMMNSLKIIDKAVKLNFKKHEHNHAHNVTFDGV